MSRPAPLEFFPPHRPFAAGPSGSPGSTTPNTPHDESHSAPASPPHTPRSLSFLTPHTPARSADPYSHAAMTTPNPPAQNPFSPPASVQSFSAEYPFAGSPGSTRASSVVDVRLPRTSSWISTSGQQPMDQRGSFSSNRPGTGSNPGSLSNPGTVGVTPGNVTPGGRRDTFASPPSRPMTIYAQPSYTSARLRRERPKSTAILDQSPTPSEDGKKKEKGARPVLTTKLDKPWITKKDPYSRVAYWITYLTILLCAFFFPGQVTALIHSPGAGAGAARIYTGWKSVLLITQPLCPVLIEDFSTATTESLFGTGVAGDGGTFFREVDASGFGNGEFEMTSNSDSNSFVLNNQLYLVPTLTSDVIPLSNILDGAVYNVTGCTYNITHSTGYTTSGHGSTGINTTEGETGSGGIAPDAPLDLPAYLAACSAVSNATQGKILPPVMSARISTRRSAKMKFGRVEVRAKLPTGDWMWPAIWMLPVDNAYGGWPLSGEIDIMEARGNGPSYPKQGVNYVRSSLNWGPATFLDAVAKTYGWWTERRSRYDEQFHTYALEWTDGFIRMYVDSRLTHMLELKFNKPFWDRGNFPTVVQNGSESVVLQNPWINGTNAAPFDQEFYLIMNVAVGGTNGWFPDGPEKPWLDGSATAPLDFLRAQSQWYPTWPQDVKQRAMVVDSVKMWELC
ncbi:unnamed protein product [Mycena citricolor]|uniref:GH16 domain-containing protein n=1 Tax=Mycena citricolor TaxID=2018698 RepID=A0AAD2HX46_9AGAR|nr:unnamed protein product [Mycena citricolor]